MTDFPALARARGFNIPEDELAAVASPLQALESAFRPLVSDLPSLLEPSTGICPEDPE